MDLPLLAEDALAQPTRAQIFAFVRTASGGIWSVCSRGGFVIRGQTRQAHGRPKDSWTVSADAHPGGQCQRAYSDLSTWLARAIPASATRLREVEAAGREIGRELAPSPGSDPAEDLRDAFAALGFEPTLEQTDGGFVCSLGNCPYRESARESPEIVCTLHRGITAGILAELDPTAKVTSFEPHDPESAGCRVEARSQS